MTRTLEWPATVLAVDVETTGTDPSSAHILSIGWAPVSQWHAQAGTERRICPGRKAWEAQDPHSAEIHGLKWADVSGAPPFEEIWESLRTALPDAIPIAHNAAFDRAMIAAEIERSNIDPSGHPLSPQRAWIDTWQRSRIAFGERVGLRHDLDSLARRVGVGARDAEAHHGAADDAALLARIWTAWRHHRAEARRAQDDLFGEPRAHHGHAATPTPIIAIEETRETIERWTAFAKRWCGEEQA